MSWHHVYYVLKKYQVTGQMDVKRRCGRPKTFSTAREQYFKVLCLRKKQLALQLIHLLFAEDSSKMVLVGEWLLRSHL